MLTHSQSQLMHRKCSYRQLTWSQRQKSASVQFNLCCLYEYWCVPPKRKFIHKCFWTKLPSNFKQNLFQLKCWNIHEQWSFYWKFNEISSNKSKTKKATNLGIFLVFQLITTVYTASQVLFWPPTLIFCKNCPKHETSKYRFNYLLDKWDCDCFYENKF